MQDLLYTVDQVSKMLKTSRGYVYELIRLGLLPALKIGRLKVRRTALEQFLEKFEGMDVTTPSKIKDLQGGN